MKRNKYTFNMNDLKKVENLQDQIISRRNFSKRLGLQYYGRRDIYAALGYPSQEELTYDWYFNKYDRESIATAVIDKPVDKTWAGEVFITGMDSDKGTDDPLYNEWKTLDKDFKSISKLTKLDKLAGIGQYGLLLFGLSDVQRKDDFKLPAEGNLQLKYLKPIAQGSSVIMEFETNTNNERYGLPLFYRITLERDTYDPITGRRATSDATDIVVHHSRVLHVTSGSLTSEVYGRPRLKPIANRIVDLEKLLGGDAEMFWRNARPGYTALTKENYRFGDAEEEALNKELDNYEHDLRRFIRGEGVDIKALEQVVSDPLNHVDIQIQAISAETGIPKRILVGSERGELSSSQDREQWLTLIDTRQEKYAQPEIIEPFVEKCMSLGIMTESEFTVVWEDLFAPSEKEKVEIGKLRSDILQQYSNSVLTGELLPPELALIKLFAFSEEEVNEIMEAREAAAIEEERRMEELEEEAESFETEEETEETEN